jgi:predicted ester cyclase
MMVAEQNAAVVRQAVEAIWNQGELDLADALFAADYVNHDGLIPDLVRGPEAIKLSVALYRTAFPHLHITVDDLLADGETVVLRWTARSTHAGARAESGPTGPQGSMSGRTRSRLAGGKIVASWTDWDQTGVLRQLGLTPAARAPGADGEAARADRDGGGW